MPICDLVLVGGTVVDPESGLEAVRYVGISGSSIAAVSEEPVQGRSVIDASGLIVAPGFIDLHSHAQSLAGRRLQACDGVTSAFDLEAGRSPVGEAYAAEASAGSPIHYGFAASWAAARKRVTTGLVPSPGVDGVMNLLGDPTWQADATPRQIDELLDRLSLDLADGAIGIGLLLGYAPGVGSDEYLSVCRLAAENGAATFTHCRDLIEVSGTAPDGAEELVRVAAETGAHMHYCHVNGSSGRMVERVLGLVARCRSEGGHVSTEAYPYGRGCTAIGAVFLAPERLKRRGLRPDNLTYLPSGERVADEARLVELRQVDPGGMVLIDFFDEDDPRDQAMLRRTLTFDDAIVASDAMPIVGLTGQFDPGQWPLGPLGVTHPRTAGCFSRSLRLWRSESAPWTEPVRRCTLLPAQTLQATCPAMRRKGRVQPGADADLVVFDPGRVTDQATYSQPTRPSTGIAHVLVDGVPVVSDGDLVPEAVPGKAVRGARRC